MTTLREAAQQALEALGKWSSGRDMGAVELNDLIAALEAALGQPEPQEIADLRQACREGWRYADELEQERKRLTAALAALEQPEQEPVAWMVYTPDGKSVCVTDNPADFTEQHKALPLYTAPPQRKPLTEDQMYEACINVWRNLPDGFGHTSSEWIEAGIRYAERAHGIVGEA